MPEIRLELPGQYQKQRDAIWSPARFACIEASTKAGKTVGCMSWILENCLTMGAGRNHMWAAPVYKQARVPFDRLGTMLNRANFPKRLWSSSLSEMVYSFAGAGLIHFRSAEKPDNLYADDIYSCVMDEASRMREEAWHAAQSTLTFTRAPGRLIGNCKGRGNWFYRLCQQAKTGVDPEFSYAKITALDAVAAGVLHPDEVESARRRMPEHVFKPLYMAEPGDDGGNPFNYDAIQRCTKPLSEGKPEYWGVDLAKYQDWTVAIGLDKDGNVAAFQRWRATWDQTEKHLISLIGDCPAQIDSTGVGDPIVERIKGTLPQVEGYQFNQQSKQKLMEGLSMAIQQERIGFPEGEIKDELEIFEYEETKAGRGYRYSAPEGMHDDCVCALALAVECMDRCFKPSFEIAQTGVVVAGAHDDDWGWTTWKS